MTSTRREQLAQGAMMRPGAPLAPFWVWHELQVLRAKGDEIVRAFVRAAREEFPSEATQEEAAIVDHVPSILEELADALETGRTSLPPRSGRSKSPT